MSQAVVIIIAGTLLILAGLVQFVLLGRAPIAGILLVAGFCVIVAGAMKYKPKGGGGDAG